MRQAQAYLLFALVLSTCSLWAAWPSGRQVRVEVVDLDGRDVSGNGHGLDDQALRLTENFRGAVGRRDARNLERARRAELDAPGAQQQQPASTDSGARAGEWSALHARLAALEQENARLVSASERPALSSRCHGSILRETVSFWPGTRRARRNATPAGSRSQS